MRKIAKKGNLTELSGDILAFVVIVVIAVVGFLVVGALRTVVIAKDSVDVNNGSGGTWTTAFNATNTGSAAMNTVISFLSIIAVVIAGGFVIRYLLNSFGRGGEGKA